MGRLGRLRGFEIFFSGAVLAAYGYDALECWKIHREALQKALAFGEQPLPLDYLQLPLHFKAND